jgi:HD-like signal output (HDOD) protein
MNEIDTDIKGAAGNMHENKLLADCCRLLEADELELPTIPEVSFKIRRAITNDTASISSIAKVVQMDPSITAQLIRISNSVLYLRQRKSESCQEALSRLGLLTAQNIITTFTMKTVFIAKSPLIQRKMSELWGHSSYVAAICAVFAYRIPGFNPDRAMLAGLVHDIGIIPILTYADKHPELIISNPDFLTQTVRKLRADIGVKIIRHWDFPDDFEDAVINAENWLRNGDEPFNYSDIVMMAQLLSFTSRADIKKIPKLEELPAYKKLTGYWDANDSVNLLDTAKVEIDHIRQILA